MDTLNTYRAGPDERGKFGGFGGRYVAETLMPLVLAVGEAYEAAKADPLGRVIKALGRRPPPLAMRRHRGAPPS